MLNHTVKSHLLNKTAVTAESSWRRMRSLNETLESSSASLKEKMDACRELAIIGNRGSIQSLASLLGDEQLSHMARYGLEPNPDPAVDDAFREALDTVNGMQLVGVIGSIGARRDAKAVEKIVPLLNSSNSEVVQAAARALGSIRTPDAIKALSKALDSVSNENKLDVCEGLFRCADALVSEGQKESARKIYNLLRGTVAPNQVKTGVRYGIDRAR